MIISCNPFLPRHQQSPFYASHLLLNPPKSILRCAGDMAVAGPSRGPDTWRPSRYLEPRHPDNEEVLEQAAYQAAVTRHGGDSRNKTYKPRRTIDYMGPVLKWRQVSFLRTRPICGPRADGIVSWGRSKAYQTTCPLYIPIHQISSEYVGFN